MKTQWFVLGIAMLLILSACDQAATTDGNADADAQADADTQADADADVQADVDVGANVDVTEDAEAYLEFLGQKSRMEWKVDYTMTTNAGGQVINSEMSMYLKGTDVRTDMSIPLLGETRSYYVDEEVVSCTKTSGSWSCTKFTAPEESEDEPDQADIEEDILEDASDYTIKADGTMSIAGTTAKCFRVVSNSEPDMVLRQCFSDEGAPLYVLMESNADEYAYRSEMKATAYSEDVSASDLAFPATPTEFDAGTYAGGTMPADGSEQDFCSYCEYLSGTEKDECLASC